MKERIIWLDNLKGFLIFIVVLGHTILFTNNEGDSNVFYRYISSFWMALFMFTSGFASYKTTPNYKVIWHRFKQLIIPFISWSVILCIINKNSNIVDLLLYPSKSVWFLWALFFINSIVVIVCKVAQSSRLSEEKLSFITVMLLLFSAKVVKNSDVFALNLICLHSVNYTVGYFVRKHFDSILNLSNSIWYIGGGVFLIMAYFNQGVFMPLGLPSHFHIIYDILCGLLSFMLFVSIFTNIKLSSSFLRKWGGNFRYICYTYCCVYVV